MTRALPNPLARHLAELLHRVGRRYRKRLARCQKHFSEEAVHELRVETRRALALLDLLRDRSMLPDTDAPDEPRARLVTWRSGVFVLAVVGVFVVAEMDHPRLRERMNDLKLGEGPYYTFYRPYHLTSLEVPLTCARAVIHGKADMVPLDRPVAEVMTPDPVTLPPSALGTDVLNAMLERRIGHLYPKAKLPREYGGGEATVIAWLWARTVKCPNPACGAQMPLVRSFALSTKPGKQAWVEPVVERFNAKTQGREGAEGEGESFATLRPGDLALTLRVRFEIRTDIGRPREGTVNRRGATCLCCAHRCRSTTCGPREKPVAWAHR